MEPVRPDFNSGPVLRQNAIRATSRLSGMPNGRRQPIKLGLTARLRETVGKAATYRQAGQSCHQVGSPGESRGGKDGLVVRVVLGRPRQAQSRRSPDVPMVQATDFADWRNVSQLRRRDRHPVRRILGEGELGPGAVVVREVCVQRRQTCSVGGSPTGATADAP
jgi:hypothetical protein